MADLLDHDNAMKWKGWFSALSSGWKTLIGLLVAGVIAFTVVSSNQRSALKSLREELKTSKKENADLKRDYLPFQTAAVVAYGKADAETLKKLADSINIVREAYKEAQGRISQLETEVERQKGQTERAVSPQKAAELIKVFKTLPKAKISIKRYEFTAEAVRYSKQLETIFKESGFEVTMHEPHSLLGGGRVGTEFMANNANQPACADDVLKHLKDSGMTFTVYGHPNLKSDQLEIAIFQFSK